MSAEILRRAAALMREANTSSVEAAHDDTFMLAVADWLDATAAEHESESGNPTVDAFFASLDTAPDVAALTVARAYLGGAG